MGELLPETQSLACFEPAHYPTVAHIQKPQSKLGSRVIHLPQTKVGKEKGEDVMICRQAGKTDPIQALLHHINTNELDPSTPIASYRTDKGYLKTIMAKSFMHCSNTIWEATDYDKLSGHCFRIGGTTFYLIMGINPNVVKAIGRWSSEAFKHYWQNIE